VLCVTVGYCMSLLLLWLHHQANMLFIFASAKCAFKWKYQLCNCETTFKTFVLFCLENFVDVFFQGQFRSWLQKKRN